MSKFNEATITKENNTLLPTGYIQWRKDIEQLIDTAKLKTVSVSIWEHCHYIGI